MPSVTVIISTYTKARSRYVLACIDSLRSQTLDPEEILLVLDPDEELRKFYTSLVPDCVLIVDSGGRGLSNARNSGVTMASGEIVAFIDDDATADRNWLRNLVDKYRDSDVVGVGGLIIPVWENGRPSWFPEELDWIVGCSYKGLPETETRVRNPIGCNMSFRRDVFQKVGNFKASFGRFGGKLLGSEEAEFSIRLLRKCPNSKIIFDPNAVVYHKIPRTRKTLSYFAKRSFYEGISKGLLESLEPKASDTLSVERMYFSHLLRFSISLRLRRIYEPKYFVQLLAILLSLFLVASGYLISDLVANLYAGRRSR